MSLIKKEKLINIIRHGLGEHDAVCLKIYLVYYFFIVEDIFLNGLKQA